MEKVKKGRRRRRRRGEEMRQASEIENETEKENGP